MYKIVLFYLIYYIYKIKQLWVKKRLYMNG